MKPSRIIVLISLLVLVPFMSACSGKTPSRPVQAQTATPSVATPTVPSEESTSTADGIPIDLVPRLQYDETMTSGRAYDEVKQAVGSISAGDGLMKVLSLWGGFTIEPGGEVEFQPLMVPYKVVPAPSKAWDHLVYRAVRNGTNWPDLPANAELICIISPDDDAALYVDGRECGVYIGGAQCRDIYMHFIVIESAWLDNKSKVDVRPTTVGTIYL